METELTPQYDGRKSFYKKAIVIAGEGCLLLRSYSTIVAEIRDGKAKVFGIYSDTTLRHIKEFLRQNGFIANTIKQIEKDYM